jgi:RNA polymerase sigma-70 factor, ECF subfamily
MPMQFQDFDACYVDRLRAGDIDTQQHFFAYFGELIRLKTRKRLNSREDIEDVRQETFTRILRVLRERNIDHPERLGAFVNSVCNHVLSEHYRSSHREIATDDEFDVPDPALGISDVLALHQMQQQVRRIVWELPDKDRRLIQALFFEERDKDEICRDFGVDREYLRVLVHRAKQAFKAQYLTSCAASRRPIQQRRQEEHVPVRVPLKWHRTPNYCRMRVRAGVTQR